MSESILKQANMFGNDAFDLSRTCFGIQSGCALVELGTTNRTRHSTRTEPLFLCCCCSSFFNVEAQIRNRSM